MLALLAVGGLRLSLPESLSAGPDWLLIVVVGILLIPTAWARQRGKDNLNKFLGYLLSSIVTVDMIWSLGLLVAALPAHQQSPKELLRSAAALWITNILVFASWYWRLDAGGPRGLFAVDFDVEVGLAENRKDAEVGHAPHLAHLVAHLIGQIR
jgi:hypothetical protein